MCPTEILAFDDVLPDSACLNTTVLGTRVISHPERNFMYAHMCSYIKCLGVLALCVGAASVQRWWARANLHIPLLADRNMRVVRDYGCLIEDRGITFRTSYLIDPQRFVLLISFSWGN